MSKPPKIQSFVQVEPMIYAYNLNSIETNPSRLHNINASITDEGDGFKYITLNISGVVTDDMKKVARFHYVAEYGDD